MQVALYNRWLPTLGGGERHSLAIAQVVARYHPVTILSHDPVSAEQIQERLGMDMHGITLRTIPMQLPEALGAVTSQFDFFINASNHNFIPNRAKHSALLVYFPLHPNPTVGAKVRYRLGRLLASTLLPNKRLTRSKSLKEATLRLQNLIPPDFLHLVQSYQTIWAISRFTQRWIHTWWQQESELIYPSIQVSAFHPLAKRQQILSVGRFFAGHHNKKHQVLIDSFKQMVDAGLQGWELHLTGGLTPGHEHQTYLHEVQQAAQGYPIQLHVDLPHARLLQLYGESSLYWHASGYGEDEQREPEKFEHFGITTIEAMASGCVPVVLGKGGQPELVEAGKSGLLWQTSEELRAHTRHLIKHPAARQQMAEQAIVQAQQFDQSHFEARLVASLQRLGVID